MSYKKIKVFSAFVIAGMQLEAFIFSNNAFGFYNEILRKGEFSSRQEIEEFHIKFNHIGFYPFTILPSIYYGMNYINFENGIPKIYTNPYFIMNMLKLLQEGAEKYCK